MSNSVGVVAAPPDGADELQHTRSAFSADIMQDTMQETLAVYQRSDHRTPPCDAHVERVFDAYARRVAGATDRPSFTDVSIATYAAGQAGCDDPMVVYVHAWALDNQRNLQGAGEFLLMAIEELEEAGYPIYMKASAEFRYADWLKAWRRGDESPAWRDKAERDLRRALAAGEFDKASPRRVYHFFRKFFTDANPVDLVERMAVMLMGWDGLDPWTKEMLLGDRERSLAWRARGHNYAVKVPEEAWPIFKRHMELAANRYRAAYALAPERPEAAAAMIVVENVSNLEEPEGADTWFERATDAEFDWIEAYNAYLHWLRPRWGGSIDDMWDFAKFTLEGDRFDTDVPQMFITVARRVTLDTEDKQGVWIAPDVYNTAMQTLEKLATSPAQPKLEGWCRSLQAAIAWWAGRDNDLLKAVDALGERLDRAALWWLGTTYDKVMARASAARDPGF